MLIIINYFKNCYLFFLLVDSIKVFSCVSILLLKMKTWLIPKKVKLIQERMRAAQSRQKSYYDKRRKDLEFAIGDHVFLRVTPWTGVGRALKSRKLTPRFIGPFEILKRVGPVAYQVALPPSLSNLHSVFHISQLRKYVHDPSHVIELDNVQVKENLTYETQPLRIDDRMVKQLRGKEIPLVKVV